MSRLFVARLQRTVKRFATLDDCLTGLVGSLHRLILMSMDTVQETPPWMAAQKLEELHTSSRGIGSTRSFFATAFRQLCSRCAASAKPLPLQPVYTIGQGVQSMNLAS